MINTYRERWDEIEAAMSSLRQTCLMDTKVYVETKTVSAAGASSALSMICAFHDLRAEQFKLYAKWRADWLVTYNACLAGGREIDVAQTTANQTHGHLPKEPT